MPLDLLLINPAAAKVVYQDLSNDLSAIEPPLWCRLIAGYCRDRGWSVSILDAEAMGLTAEGTAIHVANCQPRLIAMVVYGHQPSASTQQMTGASEACRAIKLLEPDRKIIMVGGHVAALPIKTLKEEAVDFVCIGEGPITIERLLADDAPEGIPGLSFEGRDDDVGSFISINADNLPPPLLSADDLHGNAWDLLPMHKYRAHNWQCFGGRDRQPYASVYTSLGCPFSCQFCCINAPFHSNRYRMRKPEYVVAEIEMLYREYGVRTFKIVDEMFVLNRKHVQEICEGLAALPFADELNIWAYARVDTVKDGQPELLRAAGIRWLALGIESGSAYVRDGADKHLNDGDIIETVRKIQAAGIHVLGNFIFGLSHDTSASMRKTLELATELNCEFINLYSAMAYPGSQLYRDTKPADLPTTWSGYSQHSYDCTPLPTETLSSADVLRFRDGAFKKYFANPDYLEMVGQKFGQETVAEIEKMVSCDMHRKLTAA